MKYIELEIIFDPFIWCSLYSILYINIYIIYIYILYIYILLFNI